MYDCMYDCRQPAWCYWTCGDHCLLTAPVVSPVTVTSIGAVTVMVVVLLSGCLQPSAPASAIAVTVKSPVGRTWLEPAALVQVIVYVYGSVPPPAPKTSKNKRAGAAAVHESFVLPLYVTSKECMIATGGTCWGMSGCLGSPISSCCLLYTLLGRPSHLVKFQAHRDLTVPLGLTAWQLILTTTPHDCLSELCCM
jgi:hypothetical protein